MLAERVDRFDAFVVGAVLEQQVLVFEQELRGVRRLHGDADFADFDRSGVLHQRLHHVGVHGDHPVDGLAAALRVHDLRCFAHVGEVGGHGHRGPSAVAEAAVAHIEAEHAVARHHLGWAAIAAGVTLAGCGFEVAPPTELADVDASVVDGHDRVVADEPGESRAPRPGW